MQCFRSHRSETVFNITNLLGVELNTPDESSEAMVFIHYFFCQKRIAFLKYDYMYAVIQMVPNRIAISKLLW